MQTLTETILDLSRQNMIGQISPWFTRALERQVESGVFLPPERLDAVGEALIAGLDAYRREAGLGTAVLGMSGGVDSALTAVLFKRAGWRVVGLTLPIEQNPEETARGIDACEALGLEHRNVDLTALYHVGLAALADADPDLGESDAARLRRGNVRARLRMITLYNAAASLGGLVASTDNYSELAAGFWTLHGDVGDVSPIQSLLKSWEVPYLARTLGVPEATWKATPTDGLATGGTDEQQIGATYLEWDIMVATIQAALGRDAAAASLDALPDRLDPPIEGDQKALEVYANVTGRMRRNWFKRINPLQFEHPFADRLKDLARMDAALFQPALIKNLVQPRTD
jgi:nicotinamide-nucleotide amidase